MDNRIFEVIGKGEAMLADALVLAFRQWNNNATCEGWIECREHGLILTWSGGRLLPAPLPASKCVPFIMAWLDGDFAKTVELKEDCRDIEHDGHNSLGWLVHTGDRWGHYGDFRTGICAVMPAYLWHGK